MEDSNVKASVTIKVENGAVNVKIDGDTECVTVAWVALANRLCEELGMTPEGIGQALPEALRAFRALSVRLEQGNDAGSAGGLHQNL